MKLILNRIRISKNPENVNVVWNDSWIEVVVEEMSVVGVRGKEEK